jgi:hypothetical protein
MTVTAVGACGGAIQTASTASDAGGATADAGDESSATDSSQTLPSSEASTDTPVSTTCNLADPLSDATFACCIDHETAVFMADAGADDPATKACCTAIQTRIDDEFRDGGAQFSADYQKATPVLYDCCRVIGSPIGPACTPWGPPPPPAMPGEVA